MNFDSSAEIFSWGVFGWGFDFSGIGILKIDMVDFNSVMARSLKIYKYDTLSNDF